MRRKILGAALCAAMVVGSGTAAMAGEITGNGQKVLTIEPEHVLHGQSNCAWSGQNDGYFDGSGETARVQSFGYDIGRVAKGQLGGFTPGIACNPTVPFEE